MKIAKHIHCKGKVQGVFFRASTQQQAQTMGLDGWVNNQQDGSVLIHVEGDEDLINQLVEWCHQGPRHATVTSVLVQETQVENYQSFKIIR